MSRTTAAIIGTIVWIACGVVVVWLKWDSVARMPLNSIGDSLAGFFSPVAFLWLVVGYFQQGEELKLNTKALELQVNELRMSVEQQQELVAVTRADMALSKQAYERERDKEIRQAQPIFKVVAQSYNKGHAGITQLEASISNYGHGATDVVIDCESGVVNPKNITVIEAGGQKRVFLDFSKSPVRDFKLCIHYMDGLGTIRHQEISSVKNESGHVTFLSPKEIFLTDC